MNLHILDLSRRRRTAGDQMDCWCERTCDTLRGSTRTLDATVLQSDLASYQSGLWAFSRTSELYMYPIATDGGAKMRSRL